MPLTNASAGECDCPSWQDEECGGSSRCSVSVRECVGAGEVVPVTRGQGRVITLL